jgi:hypothetical protein
MQKVILILLSILVLLVGGTVYYGYRQINKLQLAVNQNMHDISAVQSLLNRQQVQFVPPSFTRQTPPSEMQGMVFPGIPPRSQPVYKRNYIQSTPPDRPLPENRIDEDEDEDEDSDNETDNESNDNDINVDKISKGKVGEVDNKVDNKVDEKDTKAANDEIKDSKDEAEVELESDSESDNDNDNKSESSEETVENKVAVTEVTNDDAADDKTVEAIEVEKIVESVEAVEEVENKVVEVEKAESEKDENENENENENEDEVVETATKVVHLKVAVNNTKRKTNTPEISAKDLDVGHIESANGSKYKVIADKNGRKRWQKVGK